MGDSSVIGSGGYADNESAAVSCTGEGEAIMRLVLGKWAVDRVADGTAPRVAFNAERMVWGLHTANASTVEVGRSIGRHATALPD